MNTTPPIINNFFASLYELWGLAHMGNFSQTMYNHGIYVQVGLLMLGISFFLVIFYYYLLNHPGFIRWFQWGIILLVNCLVNSVIAYVITSSQLYIQGYAATTLELTMFALINGLIWAPTFFFLFAFVRKIRLPFLRTAGVNTPF
ncbi:hypothetical protein [Spirosoma sp.]|uniref:hypothetical protein n=1 Tax=Spirosoma sp. TaxID=1899569 RepID=UPI003B3A333A